MAAGLLDPTDGSVQIGRHDGRQSRGPSPAVVAQRHADVLRRPVAVGAPRVRRSTARCRRLAAATPSACSRQIGLTTRRDDLPTTFSRGLRQKAAITLAFIRPFELLLVDEPFVGLDEPGKHALLTLFDRASPNGADPRGRDPRADASSSSVGRLVALRDGGLGLRRSTADTDVARPRAAELTTAGHHRRPHVGGYSHRRPRTLRSRSMQEFDIVSASSYDPPRSPPSSPRRRPRVGRSSPSCRPAAMSPPTLSRA